MSASRNVLINNQWRICDIRRPWQMLMLRSYDLENSTSLSVEMKKNKPQWIFILVEKRCASDTEVKT